jgi:lipopolysaccharide transport system permease protein
MIASPVFYPAAMIPERWRLVFAINPMVGVIEGFRAAVLETPIDWTLTLVSAVSLVVLCVLSAVVFRSMEDTFADVI